MRRIPSHWNRPDFWQDHRSKLHQTKERHTHRDKKGTYKISPIYSTQHMIVEKQNKTKSKYTEQRKIIKTFKVTSKSHR